MQNERDSTRRKEKEEGREGKSEGDDQRGECADLLQTQNAQCRIGKVDQKGYARFGER
jgi:hypothetical protein